MRRLTTSIVALLLLSLVTGSTASAAEQKPPDPATPAAAPAPAPAPAAAEPAAPADDSPVHVMVGIYVLSIGKFDVATGTYTVDFYINLKSKDGRDIGDARFEFMNGRATGAPDKLVDKPSEKFYRVQANLMTNVNMKRFPWDRHELPIIIESATRSKKELIYEVDTAQTGIDPSVLFIGWNLDRAGSTATVQDHVYKPYDETYSQYVLKLKISRLMFMSSLKTFLPVASFLLISMISLLVSLDKLDSRVGMNTAMLIASVMFHLSISNQVPPAGYLTVADKVMIATYGSIGLNLLISVVMMRLMHVKETEKANKLRERSFVAIPVIAALSYTVAFLV